MIKEQIAAVRWNNGLAEGLDTDMKSWYDLVSVSLATLFDQYLVSFKESVAPGTPEDQANAEAINNFTAIIRAQVKNPRIFARQHAKAARRKSASKIISKAMDRA